MGMKVFQNLQVPGTGMKVLKNSQKFRVFYGSLTKLAEVPGRYINVVPVPAPRYHKVPRTGYIPRYLPHFLIIYPTQGRARVWDVVPVPRVL